MCVGVVYVLVVMFVAGCVADFFDSFYVGEITSVFVIGVDVGRSPAAVGDLGFD